MGLRPICKRKSDPRAVQKLWAGITYIRSQKQVSNLERLTRYVQREYEMTPAQAEQQLQLAVEDGLVEAYSATATKGSNVGAQQDGFRISPEADGETRGKHDWYCYDCHKSGEVLECDECWRVYHVSCTDVEAESGGLASLSFFVCAVCKDIKKQSRMKRKELNRLLGFTIMRLKDKSRELHWFGGRDLGLDRFVYQYMDLNTMEEKTTARRYKYLEQFYSDARAILHNIFICYGDNGVIPDLARLMIRDCRYDLDEIRQCKDCYNHSNARMEDWFCQPCRPAHEIVYAKQKGFSFWPAKVIKVTQEGYDVRFFGALHQRAMIPATAIKPLDANPKQLALKRTMGFVKSMKELERYQEMLLRQGAGGGASADTDEQSGGDNDVDEEGEEKTAKKSRTSTLTINHDSEPKSKKKKKKKAVEYDDDVEDSELEEEELSKKKKKKLVGVVDKLEKVKHGKNKVEHKKRRGDSLSNTAGLKIPGRGRGHGALEDSYLVSSSEDKIHGVSRVFTMSDIGVQTSKKLAVGGRRPTKGTQTDSTTASTTGQDDPRKREWADLDAVKALKTAGGAAADPEGWGGDAAEGATCAVGASDRAGVACGCEAKYSRIFHDERERMEGESREDKEKALAVLEERLRGEFDEERQKAVQRAVAGAQRDAERVRHQTEERCRTEAEEETKKLTQKHKQEVSLAKKKQWCYNCEEEAMYHCCWNTSYCSIKCQQEHWHTEHKRMCRRKRN